MLVIVLSLNATSQELTRVPGIYGYVYDFWGNPVASGTPVNLTVKVHDRFTGALIYNESRTTFTGGAAVPDNFYYFTEDNAPYGLEGENNTFYVGCCLGYQVGVNISNYGRGEFPESTFQLDIHVSYASNLFLDVGNDSTPPWEWEQSAPGAFTGTAEWADLDPNKINMILRNNCSCSGCILDETTSECIIPLVFSSETPGGITVEDIYVKYESLEVIDNVDYNNTFQISEGANWTIDYWNDSSSSTDSFTFPAPEGYSGADVQFYTGGVCGRNPGIDLDAVDDAIWRLLDRIEGRDDLPDNCRLDKMLLPRGVRMYFDPDTMFFRVRRYPATPILWGPVLVKLIVWI